MAENCPFCNLANEQDRIIYENELFAVLPTKGQISKHGGHILVVTKTHTTCLAAVPKEHLPALEEVVEKTRKAVTAEYGIRPLMFEHGIIGQTVPHAHLQVLPTSHNPADRVAKDFPQTDIKVMRSISDLRFEYVCRQTPYLYWQSQDTKVGYACWNPPAPKQYFRLAVAEAIRRPRWGDWRKLYEDPALAALDQQLITETTARLRPRFS